MKKHSRLCPTALYIGHYFAERRKQLGYDSRDVAAQIACAEQEIIRFEHGKNGLDVLLILNIEYMLKIDYFDYKPPVSYFGFLGFTACKQQMLKETKYVAQKLKRSFRHPQARSKIDNALLSLRFTPLRGSKENIF